MEEIKYKKLTLSYTGAEYSVISCEKGAKVVEIPNSINGDPVTSIDEHAFEKCTELLSLKIDIKNGEKPNLREIGYYAFSYCEKLAFVDIPDSVTVIDRGAFYCCSALETVILPKDCYIGPYAFARCSSLKKITTVPCVSEGMFSECEKLAKVTLAPSLKEIEEYAFEGAALTDIVIPASVNHIGALAFRGCYELKTVTFEIINGWFWTCRYNDESYYLDVDDPEHNAYVLSRMDFDDGVEFWERV